MGTLRIPYHKAYREVALPDCDNIRVIRPEYSNKAENEERAIFAAIRNPIGKPALHELVTEDSSVSIVADDITRPTPTKKILGPLLSVLVEAGVRKEQIKIIFALGTHRRLDREEERKLLGDEILDEYDVIQHSPRDELVKIEGPVGEGDTIEVNKWVANVSLRVLTGIIKPHAFAGYTGGAKSILPGVSGLHAIRNNHSYEFIAHPSSSVGIIEGNPVRRDMEKRARLLEPNFLLNVILNDGNEIVAVVAGDLIEAHRKGVHIQDEMVKVKVDSPADVVLAACPFPTDLSLYQASFGAIVAKSVVKKGGVIILVAHCPEGLGEKEFADLLTAYANPQELLDALSNPGFFECGQWTVQIWTEILKATSLIIVSDGGIPNSYYESSSIEHATSIEGAWERAKQILKKGTIHAYALPEAPFTIPFL